ncbi:hypothetical protein [Candidatus Vampirococcus lugosii]|uniref:Uncharacterized protein n=1 Tax=Candidatus Vampirococcus lugosii TaxID=2789015 RepID=A0ABS5QKN1_9BACT|nr:hypothetical protein [Candidatus Vampirococcus lugosii]MBS8121632.1 hypothetical protein [Candidatus Vampirococcus lugosii]
MKKKNSNIGEEDVIDSFLEGVGEEDSKEYQRLQQQKLEMKKEAFYKKMTSILVVYILLIAFVSTIVYFYSLYYKYNLEDNSQEKMNYINSFEENRDKIYGYLDSAFSIVGINYFNVSSTVGLDKLKSISEFDSIDQFDQSISEKINLNAPYIDKRDSLSKFMQDSVSVIKDLIDDTENKRDNLASYGYLPQEVDGILENTKIQRALLSIEAIKFYSSMKVFYNFDDFMEKLIGKSSDKKSLLGRKFKYFIDRGEQDIQNYLVNCYLNPYENLKCDRYGDFDDLYKDIDKFDSKTFKEIIKLIDEELELDELPQLSIILNSMEEGASNISFSVDVNTYAKDIESMIDRGIKNPHIYISNTLINSIRSSSFIVGKEIKFNTLEVSDRTVTVQENEINVLNSTFDFDVPIQESVEREIYDFVVDVDR